MDVDAAYEIAKSILGDAAQRLGQIQNEEDAKVQLITRMLTEALGWDFKDIGNERLNENGFSDYVISDGERTAFLIEAKRIGAIEITTKVGTKGYYKISGPVLKLASEGIKQAASYAQPLGIPMAVVTDGILWIIFLPWVPQANYAERQAIVFPGIDAILRDFAMFFELLSKAHSRRGTHRVIFDSIHENRLVLDRELVSPIRASENTIVQKSALAFDLESVFASFFSELAGDRDPDMLIECFVETRESRIADFSLERLTKNVLGNIDPAERDVNEGLRAVVQGAVAGDVGQTVFIVGPSGAGKSTFLDRFFVRTLSEEIQAKCVVIKIDALDASGDESVALSWMTEQAIKAIEGQLFTDGIPEWNELQALYHLEYLRRSKGVDAAIYQRSKQEFKEKFAKYVEEQVENAREGYLRRLLADIVKNRKRLPVFVIDNTDEFTLSFKVAVFQYFQALRREANHCILIFPATDRSAWSFSKTDIFNIYSTKSFFLPTPSPREVFRKRVDYLKKKTVEAGSPSEGAEYVASRGIRVSIRNLGAFADVVETIFVNQDFAAKRVGELANYNMRKALGLSKRVITSSVLNLEDLVRSYLTGDMVAPNNTVFTNALVKGDYEFFKFGDEPLLFPLFQVDTTIRQSPLTAARILSLLADLNRAVADDAERYMTVSSIFAYFGVMAMPEAAVQRSLEMLLQAGLVEPYDLSKKDYSDDQRLAITHSGLAHLDLGIFNPVFFEQLALTTRIGDPDLTAEMREAFRSSQPYPARLERVRETFAKYLCDEDARNCSIPDRPEFKSQAALTDELLSRWTTRTIASEDIWRAPDVVAESVAGVVENFDHQRGFGFVELPSLRDSAFLHARTVEQAGVPEVYDGDELVCDVTSNDKGLVVSRIHSVSVGTSIEARGIIVKTVPDRRFGFMNIPSLGVDAFFHFHLFSPEQQRFLKEGEELQVEVKTDATGRSQVRRLLGVPEPVNK